MAHWIELGGISTVVIGLVREHLQKTAPPRALWVPFELGRPLGAPGDPAFQKRVLSAALDMITKQSSTSTLKDFLENDPRATPDAGWRAPVAGKFESIFAEVQALMPARDTFFTNANKTAVGVAKIDITDCALLVDALDEGMPLNSPRTDTSPLLITRFAIDDLKSFYIEAALANGSPTSRQIYDWFWSKTYLGARLHKLRQQWMQSDNDKLKRLGTLFVIPHRWR